MMKTVALWITGMAASGIFGGFVGMALAGVAGDGGNSAMMTAAQSGILFGAPAGIFTFICARLWAHNK